MVTKREVTNWFHEQWRIALERRRDAADAVAIAVCWDFSERMLEEYKKKYLHYRELTGRISRWCDE